MGRAIRELGIIANARKQVPLQFLTQQRVRAGAVLKTASLGCAPDEIRCWRAGAIPDAQPVSLSSGHAEMEATRRFAGKGLAGFIQKPYTAARLADQIRKALANTSELPRTS